MVGKYQKISLSQPINPSAQILRVVICWFGFMTCVLKWIGKKLIINVFVLEKT